ncbi:MAG: DUF6438 domain-containing protein, partial [Sphingomonadales bacterium]
PVVTLGTVELILKRAEKPPDRSVPFPEVDYDDLEINLVRTACFGICPDYHVSIRGDGLVRFSTEDYPMLPDVEVIESKTLSRDVREHLEREARKARRMYGNSNHVIAPGVHEMPVSADAVRALVEKFRAASFFSLKDEYRADMTDLPTTYVFFRTGRHEKVVIDYGGEMAGMPSSITELADMIDDLAATDRWVEGNERTLASLAAEGTDFRSLQALDMALMMAGRGNAYDRSRGIDGVPDRDIIDMIGLRGLPLDALYAFPESDKKEVFGHVLLGVAAASGREALFRALAARMPPKPVSQSALDDWFIKAGCNPGIARALVAAGARPDAGVGAGTSALLLDYWPVRCAWNEGEMLLAISTLLDLGVPVDAINESGQSVLFSSDSPALTALLIARGADVNLRAKDGTVPVLAAWDDRVVLLLLQAGADPKVRNAKGTLRDHAVRNRMVGTLSWLDEHGVK